MTKRRKSKRKSKDSRRDQQSPNPSRPAETGRSQPLGAKSGHRGASTPSRNSSLDALRGLAIVLMVVDHIADVVFDLTIQSSFTRTATRLSMPLFCLLMGYFFRPERPFRPIRLLQITVSALLVNLVFYPHYDRIEILGSLLIAYLLFLATRQYFCFFVLAILLYPIDPLTEWLDFPFTIVVSFVALGMVLQRLGFPWAVAIAVLLTIAGLWIQDFEPVGVNHKLCFFALPATCLVAWASKRQRPAPHWLWAFVRLGHYPLSAYVTQYYVIFGLDALTAGQM